MVDFPKFGHLFEISYTFNEILSEIPESLQFWNLKYSRIELISRMRSHTKSGAVGDEATQNLERIYANWNQICWNYKVFTDLVQPVKPYKTKER